MATIFKNFLNNDVATTRTLLHEAIPLTGTIVSGTYTADGNIKNYAHGMFQSVYDYPYLSSSANHVFDITCGYSSNSTLADTDVPTYSQQGKKINIYNQMAQTLVGYDETGGIKDFPNHGASDDPNMREAFFLNFARLLSKDEIKKGSFSMTLLTGGAGPPDRQATSNPLQINDTGSLTDYRVNSPAGEYGFLYTTTGSQVGLIYYQAGIAVLTASTFATGGLGGINDGTTPGDVQTHGDGGFGPAGSASYNFTSHSASVDAFLSGSTISGAADGVRNCLDTLSFNNTTELNSTIYFCRASHTEFNYSSNPTYLDASKLVVKNASTDMPVSYITSVGLYSADNELLATAKLSEPLKKTPTNELTLRVRLDY